MSGRGKGVRRKTRSSPYETQWDSNNPSNWTINKLKEELNKKGIRTPSEAVFSNGGTDRNIAQCFEGLQETFKQLIYRDNCTHDTGRDREFNLQQWYNHAGIGNRSEISNRGNNTVLHGNTQEHASFISGPQVGNVSCGVRSDEYSNVDIISPSIQKQIIDGKDVNLASLLIPNYETPQIHSVAANGLELNISGKPDPRLNRKLTIQEFIKAFGKFKRVMSSVYPDRRAELDAYEDEIIEY
ncbi:Hypothetical predicted protein [Mytilus galloprovincialis]|uniref:Uncharacterized protein n=1 Tax=Mytilus galloprovincialis TaxID=29158 RepID=A0A8B6GZZ8_MYTGA|nr:Hypothetical predicted protein [Mytilus galloprovincialis]